MSQNLEQVVILVGGKGSRLGELSRYMPKPLMQVQNGLTFLDILLENYARQGFKSILLLACHLGEIVKEYYDGKRISQSTIKVFIENEPKGTAGALLEISEYLQSYFILSNGDSFYDINYRAFVRDALLKDNDASLALFKTQETQRYGSIQLKNNKVIEFKEKNAISTGLINAGVYLCKKQIIENIKNLPCSIEMDVFPGLAKEGRLGGYIYDGYFIDIGLPATLDYARATIATMLDRPAVFFDRDGVLNYDRGYTHKIADFEWMPGAKEAILSLNNQGFRVFVVTNQAGVAKGYYDEKAVLTLHDFMQKELNNFGAYVDQYYYCPYHPDGNITNYALHHPDRKPEPGMILKAFDDWKINRDHTFLIGDKETDLEAARKANIKGYLFPGGNLNKFIELIKLPSFSPKISQI